MLLNLLNHEINETDYFIENNVRIIYKRLPMKVYGFIHRYRDINLIVINWNISKDKKKRTILHELAHLELHHLDKSTPLFGFYIENVEDEAERYLKFIEESLKDCNDQLNKINMF